MLSSTNSIAALFFASLDFSDYKIGLFMTLTLVGDVILGGFLTLIADRSGRRKVLIAGSFLMVMSGTVFAIFSNFWILLVAAIFGVISASAYKTYISIPKTLCLKPKAYIGMLY